MDGKRYRIQGANTLSLPAEDAEKLLALGDGECALLYLYILRSGGVLDTAAAKFQNASRHFAGYTVFVGFCLPLNDFRTFTQCKETYQ